MDVILLTVFIGLVMVALFIALFLRIRRDSEGSCPERESLLPLVDDEQSRPQGHGRHSTSAPRD